MKILIITYYKEYNPGTFLQAYGVQYAWRQKYPDAEIEYLNYAECIKESGENYNGPQSPMSLLQKIKHVIANRRRYAIMKVDRKKYMHTACEMFDLYPSVEQQERFIEYCQHYDIISIGSDTILESFFINGNWGVMWPSIEIRSKKVFFAGSADSAKNLYNKTELFAEAAKRILDFAHIGLRDDVTINFFEQYLGINKNRLIKQPDPTFFLPLNLFHLDCKKAKLIPKNRKVVFYHFDRRFRYRKELAILLKAQGYYLLTTEYDPNVDLSFNSLSAFEWAEVFRFCDYVITERFHDTVFAMRWNVPVITIDWNLEKVSDKGESKRLSIIKDFGFEENYVLLQSKDDLYIVLKKLTCIDVEAFKAKSAKKVVELQGICTNIMKNL